MHTNPANSRRIFIKQILGGSLGIFGLLYAACNTAKNKKINGRLMGSNAATGHMLRDRSAIPPSTRTTHTNTLIVGGGISGLSAARCLHKAGRDFMLIELEDHFGGNSHFGRNQVSAYPWAAHYLPVPDVRNKEILDLLQELNVIMGYEGELPVYNDYHLCHDPEERLYINGYWQEGLVPEAGISVTDKQHIKRFFDIVNQMKVAMGNDGKDAFAIPLDNSSRDPQYTRLDGISFRQYLNDNGLTSGYLAWYLEYCCKDDYGSRLDTTSAWAGLHYFASRKGKAVNSNASGVLTWPNGNGFLAQGIRAGLPKEKMHTGNMVVNIDSSGQEVKVTVYDIAAKSCYTIVAGKIIMATPQYINKYLLPGQDKAVREGFSYSPWVVANITLHNMPESKGMPLCWDNVIYGTPSVGYVNATHQNVGRTDKTVLTFYLPLSAGDAAQERQAARTKDHQHWVNHVLKEMEFAHPGITQYVENIDVWVWGHGMIAPVPGFVWGNARQQAAQPIDNKVFFAHSDLSGISIFEEAFYQGIKAAKQLLAT